MLRYYKQRQCFIKLFCKYSCCGTISKSTISSIFFVNIHICLLSVSKSLQQRYIFSCLWHCQQLPVCFKMSQSVPICLKMSQNVSKCLKINSIFLKTHFETFWDILRHFEQFWAILSGFLGQVWDILRHFELILSNFEQFWADFCGRYETFWDILSWFWAILSNFEQFWAILSDFERNLFGQQFVYLNSPFNLHVIPAQLEFTNYGDWS